MPENTNVHRSTLDSVDLDQTVSKPASSISKTLKTQDCIPDLVDSV